MKTSEAVKQALSHLNRATRLAATVGTSEAHVAYLAELTAAEIQQAYRVLSEVVGAGKGGK